MTISSVSYAVLFALLVSGSASIAQNADPLSFFPHQVGDRWDYVLPYGFRSLVLNRDSIAVDGSHNLFYGIQPAPEYRIDSALSVFWMPQDTFLNYCRYKLAAGSCEAWENPRFGSTRWAWVARVESMYVFGRRTVVKVFKYAPGNPCGLGSLEEDWLANGFGLIYRYREPNEISYLRGCIIAGDTFGILTSVPREEQPIAKNYILCQNYPNPFNPTTTISLEIPKQAILSLKVFDLLGREIEALAEGTYARGVHKFSWNASASPSGVYFCRMQANGNVRSIKMLLSK